EVLRGVANCSAHSGVSAVLKGGTSLSKAYGLIRRFSEDVDVIVIVPGHSTGGDDRCLKSFVTAAQATTGLAGEVDASTATKGVKRTAVFTYPTSLELGALRRGVALELGVRGGTMPTQQRQVVSLVVEHAVAAGLNVDFIEVDPIGLHVLAPVRTLVEKLTIVHHAATNGDADEQARLARHYYDIWCLLNDDATMEAIAGSPVDVLAREVVTFTHAAGLETSIRPADGFAASPAFSAEDTGPARAAYDSVVVSQLVWPNAPQPTFDECCAIVRARAAQL
ncbi:MAG: nucleotidyl transferase AbiEii/AbiGii toxin family protein, partial [Acidimicrobiia bacterium]|nr:nucleotidyl transferase AbiEii/AbiGii toxin family protein [Acidimicrobiia bacterium]